MKALNCHCLLVPVDMIPDLPEIGKKKPLRGDPDSDIGPIIEIGPNEQRLKALMDEYNLTVGKLPEEIYDMPLERVADYLEDLLRGAAPRSGLPSAPGGLKTVEKAKKTLWDQTLTDFHEYGATYTRDGKFLTTRRGTRHSISWTAEECRDVTGGILWHTHPTYDVAFSFEDVKFAQTWNLKEMGVISKNHFYTIKPRRSWADVNPWMLQFHYNRVKMKYHAEYTGLYDRLIAAGQTHEYAEEAANHALFIDLWTELSEKFDLEFKIIKKRGGG